MNIFLCYGYHPNTTSVYFEIALRKQHDVHYIGTPWGERLGRTPNEDISVLVRQGVLPKPDLVLFIESGMRFFPRGLERMECPTAGYMIDVHTTFRIRKNYAPFFDHIFVAHKDYVPRFEQLGFQNVHWMPVACDPEIHGRVDAKPQYEVGFVGNLDQSQERKRLLLALEARYTMNDFRKPYPKEDLTQVYSRSKIAFNYAINKDVNMRVFEAIAAGSLLLTSHIDNGMNDLLRVGEHFVEFEDERSLFQQVDHFLTHEEDRHRIAETGRKFVIAEHTYERRCEAMLEAIRAPLGPARTAKARSMSSSDLRRAYGNVYSDLRLVDSAFDEFSTAWEAKEGRLAATKGLAKTLLRRFNATIKLSQIVRGTRREQ